MSYRDAFISVHSHALHSEDEPLMLSQAILVICFFLPCGDSCFFFLLQGIMQFFSPVLASSMGCAFLRECISWGPYLCCVQCCVFVFVLVLNSRLVALPGSADQLVFLALGPVQFNSQGIIMFSNVHVFCPCPVCISTLFFSYHPFSFLDVNHSLLCLLRHQAGEVSVCSLQNWETMGMAIGNTTSPLTCFQMCIVLDLFHLPGSTCSQVRPEPTK